MDSQTKSRVTIAAVAFGVCAGITAPVLLPDAANRFIIGTITLTAVIFAAAALVYGALSLLRRAVSDHSETPVESLIQLFTDEEV